MCLRCLHRPYSKNHETPNLTLAPLPPPVHPRDSHTPGRGPAAISRLLQELPNGDRHSSAKPSSSCTRPDDMDTDGEIDVDDCDDREYHPPVGKIQIFRTKCKKYNTFMHTLQIYSHNKYYRIGLIGKLLQDELGTTPPPGVS